MQPTRFGTVRPRVQIPGPDQNLISNPSPGADERDKPAELLHKFCTNLAVEALAYGKLTMQP